MYSTSIRHQRGSGSKRSAAKMNHNVAPQRTSSRKKAGIKPSPLASLESSLRREAEHWVHKFVKDTHCSYLYATAVVESLALSIPYARLSKLERNKEMMDTLQRGAEKYAALLGAVIARAEFDPALRNLGEAAAVSWLRQLTNDAIDDLLAVGYSLLFSELSRESVWKLVSRRFSEGRRKTECSS